MKVTSYCSFRHTFAKTSDNGDGSTLTKAGCVVVSRHRVGTKILFINQAVYQTPLFVLRTNAERIIRQRISRLHDTRIDPLNRCLALLARSAGSFQVLCMPYVHLLLVGEYW
jgi:hypothetical protein